MQHVDGNALAGPLAEFFTFDITMATGRCNGADAKRSQRYHRAALRRWIDLTCVHGCRDRRRVSSTRPPPPSEVAPTSAITLEGKNDEQQEVVRGGYPRGGPGRVRR